MKFGTYVTQFKVEVYPLVLKLCVYPAVNDIKVSLFSRSYTFGKYNNNELTSNYYYNIIIQGLLYRR